MQQHAAGGSRQNTGMGLLVVTKLTPVKLSLAERWLTEPLFQLYQRLRAASGTFKSDIKIGVFRVPQGDNWIIQKGSELPPQALLILCQPV